MRSGSEKSVAIVVKGVSECYESVQKIALGVVYLLEIVKLLIFGCEAG